MVVMDGATQKILCSDCRTVIGSMTKAETAEHKSFAEKVGEEPLEKAN